MISRAGGLMFIRVSHDRIKVAGVWFAQQRVKCGNKKCRRGCMQGLASHGPYWYAFGWTQKTGHRSKYVGKDLPAKRELARIAATLKPRASSSARR